MKPILKQLFYVDFYINVHFRYSYASIIIVMFSFWCFPSLHRATKRTSNVFFIETVASIIQFTPKTIVGCVRLVQAILANLGANINWITRKAAVEDVFEAFNSFIV